MKDVVGLFATHADARTAVEQLVAAGLKADAISVATPADTGEVPPDAGTADGATAIGALAGAAAGTLVGLMVAGSTIVIPGIGPCVVAGAVPSALAGAGVGTATGGLMGAVVGSSAPDPAAGEVLAYQPEGPVVLAARVPDDRAVEVEGILDDNGSRQTHAL
jgi:hypothetical protein